MYFTLCIPTMNRFDRFLSKNLSLYLQNELINEIIICDEIGTDVEKIRLAFDNPKLKLFINESKLGPFMNKLKCCKLATNEWIALIDSDNFAGNEYFGVAQSYILNNIVHERSILAPDFAKPNFNFSHLSGWIYKKGTLKTNYDREYTNKQTSACSLLMNTGNYVLNKFLIDNLCIDNDMTYIVKSSACDVIFMNTLMFEYLDAELHVVPGLNYEHVVHNDSIWIQTNGLTRDCISYVNRRFKQLIDNN